MSAKDSQFIERALVHPWMFWVFFWKWPRILRQVCGEYDLVAKDRDAAKAAHEQAVAANEKVRKWIHVTHQLDATADLRAIWTAGKRLSILLVFFVATNAYGQAPPYLRNQWTTNANPLALKVISTNGVHAATNVWELDFTNTATVTVSAVSNANKVMVSFMGSASSGSSSLTNALLHAGPTNGSVDALILTAGNGVTLTTSGTNREISLSTNILIGSSLWTNFSVADAEGGYVRGLRESNGVMRVASFGVNFLTNFAADFGSLVSLGYEAGENGDGFSSQTVHNYGDYSGDSQVLTNALNIFNFGWRAGQQQSVNASANIFNIGAQAGSMQKLTNSAEFFNLGSDAPGVSVVAINSTRRIFNVGTTAGGSASLDKCDGIFNFGFAAGAALKASNAVQVYNFGYGAYDLNDGQFLTNSKNIFNYGYNTAAKQKLLESSNIYSYGTYAGSNQTVISANRYYTYGAYSGAASGITNSADIYGFGSYTFRDAHIHSSDRIFGLDYDAFEHASLTNCQSISGYGFEAFESSVLTSCSNIVAIGPHSGTNLTLTGVSNIVMVGNIGTNVPTTDEFYLGRAQNTYRMPGNIGTIRGVSGYSWPTAHAAGVWTNDGAGVTGWKPLSDFGGGSGIGSIFTNNVLAGGPGLTELEFTNSATVLVAATTNAGRVTVSFDASIAGSGIATNAGTGWNTSFLQPSTTSKAITVTQVAGSLTNTMEILGAASAVGPFGTNLLGISAGIITNDSHLIDMTANWSNSAVTFTGLKMNVTDTASGASSKFIDLLTGGTSAAIITKSGSIRAVDAITTGLAAEIYTTGANALSRTVSARTAMFYTDLFMNSGFALKWSANASGGGDAFAATDTAMRRQAAGVVEINSGTAGTQRDLLARTATVTNLVTSAIFMSRFATNANVAIITNFTTWALTSVAVLATFTLPSASTCSNQHFIIKDEGGNASATNLTIAVQSGDRIDGATTATINVNYGAKNIYSAGGTNFFIY